MNALKSLLKRLTSDPQLVLLLLVLVLATASLSLFAGMLTPAIAAVVIAFLLEGGVAWLMRRGFGRLAAASITFGAFTASAVIVLLLVIPPLVRQIGAFVEDSPAIFASLQEALLSLQTRFPDFISPEQITSLTSRLGNEAGTLGPRLVEYSVSGVASALTLTVYAVLVPVMVFFFLKDKDSILNWCSRFLPQERSLLERVWREVLARAGDYARGKVYEIIIVGGVAFITYQAVGLRYTALLAVATGLSVLIPYVGAAVTTLPIALVAYFQWGFSAEMGTAVAAYLILQALDGNVLSPLLFSEVVKLHPNAIIIAILIFGGLWGFWGVFFAIPLATLTNAVLRAWQESLNVDTTSEIAKDP